MHFEIIVRHVDGGNIISEKLIKEIEIKKPESIIDIGFRHAEQVKIIGDIQDSYIPVVAGSQRVRYMGYLAQMCTLIL